MTDENRRSISLEVNLSDIQAWLRACGYRGAPCALTDGAPGIVFSRLNEPTYLAMIGETLIWNGKDVVVEAES